MLTTKKAPPCGDATNVAAAEATNFATPSWLYGPGKEAKVCQCHRDTVRVDIREMMEAFEQKRAQDKSGRQLYVGWLDFAEKKRSEFGTGPRHEAI